MKRYDKVFMPFVFILVAVFLAKNLYAEVEASKPYKEAAIQKSVVSGSGQGQIQDKSEIIQKAQKLQVPFIANNGQVDEQVRFYAKTFGGTVFVTKDGEIVYALPKTEKSECRLGEAERTQQSNPKSTNSDSPNPKSGVALREEFVGARVKTIQGEDPSVTKVNYFRGNDPSKWKTNVSTYDYVNLGEIYNGIELRLKAYGDNVEKLFCVKPGAGPEQIRISLSGIQPPESPFIKGDCADFPLRKGGEGVVLLRDKQGADLPGRVHTQARGLWVNEEGQLVAETELGPVKFTKPIAYQEIDGKRVEVEVEYSIHNPDVGWVKRSAPNKNDLSDLNGLNRWNDSDGFASLNPSYTSKIPKSKIQNLSPTSIGDPQSEIRNPQSVYGFTVASYDRTKPLIIDPLLASTFLGGSGSESGQSLALDTSGNVYVTGFTGSTDFPTTSGAYDTSQNGGNDVFVSKLNSGLTSLLVSTFLGGFENDQGLSLTLDTSGNVYVTGLTSSPNFPTTGGAYDTSLSGYDVFVSKLNSGLTSLLASTFLGGEFGINQGQSLTLDTSGNVYVTGYTTSSLFPTTIGAYDTSFNGGTDVFVSKLNGGLTRLLASTFLGGGFDNDQGQSLTLDTSGNVYVTGWTGSSDFPTTRRAYDTSFNGATDVFVSKLNSGLTRLLASTYLGGSGGDHGNSLTLDTSGKVYVTGNTGSSDFPTTRRAYDTSYNGAGATDVFVSKLNSGLTSLLASTYLGGFDPDEGYSLTLDTSGNVCVTGFTESTDFPTTVGAYDTSHNVGNDVFVSKLDGNLSAP